MAADVGGGDSGHGKKKAKKGRGKKANPRIDMTPMVDLGFLLLTFFVLTTTMNTPKSLPIVMPDKVRDIDVTPPDKIAQSKVLTFLCADGNRLFWYRREGDEADAEANLNLTTYSAEGVRKVIKEQRKAINEKWVTDKDKDPSIILIKLADDSVFSNMVDLLDEMAIVDQKKYMMVDITKDELDLIKLYEESQLGGGAASTAPSSPK
jgi:biopolymer transport protein ExbD